MTVGLSDGLLLGLGIAIGLYVLPRAIKALVYVAVSLLGSCWWTFSWGIVVLAQRRAKTEEKRGHAQRARTIATVLAFGAWARGDEAQKVREKLIVEFNEACDMIRSEQ